ncbi:MAG: sulfite exporter TauE/SafE family protein [Deltaproteobacteria bacterium]|nr:sulfite exporter TauE/SafE family protein [Deltaproteobacteria bacterium]
MMLFDMPAFFVVLGLMVGALSGLLGIGGGILVVPFLVYGLGWPEQVAHGTTLAMLMLPVGFLSTWQYHRRGEVRAKAAVLMFASFVPGGYVGGLLAHGLSSTDLRRLFGAFALLVGFRMWSVPRSRPQPTHPSAVPPA